ncbi:MAG TPA: tetratricopeptide repeat protein [bacterium]|nr:tetratricopeptide repeat protein [bacterium]
MFKRSVILIVGLLLLISCGGPQKDASGYWKSAKALADVGNYEGAIDQYNKILKYYPSDSLAPKSLLRIGEIKRSNTNQYQGAIKTYKKFINKYPKSPSSANAMFMIGYVYANDLKNQEEARQAYKSFLDKYSDHELAPSAEWELKNLGKELEDVIQADQLSEDKE